MDRTFHIPKPHINLVVTESQISLIFLLLNFPQNQEGWKSRPSIMLETKNMPPPLSMIYHEGDLSKALKYLETNKYVEHEGFNYRLIQSKETAYKISAISYIANMHPEVMFSGLRQKQAEVFKFIEYFMKSDYYKKLSQDIQMDLCKKVLNDFFTTFIKSFRDTSPQKLGFQVIEVDKPKWVKIKLGNVEETIKLE